MAREAVKLPVIRRNRRRSRHFRQRRFQTESRKQPEQSSLYSATVCLIVGAASSTLQCLPSCGERTMRITNPKKHTSRQEEIAGER